MIRAAVLLILAVALGRAALAQEGLPTQPILVIDPGVHTASIRRSDVGRDGEIAVTGSDDRTVRVWSMADGRLLQTIRAPQASGNVGKINAVAIGPDGEVIAAGGWTRWTADDPQDQIYLFDATTLGEPNVEILERIDGLPSVVNHLAFSRDGRRLAATLGGGYGVRIYDRDRGWAEVADHGDYGGDSYGADFAPDGRLTTTSWDGWLRLYDSSGELMASVDTGLQRPFGVAFDKDGDRIAVGFLHKPEVRLFDGRTLELLEQQPDTEGVEDGDFLTVAWSSDGGTLYAGGLHQAFIDGVWTTPVMNWPDRGAGERRVFPAGSNSIMSLKALPEGDLLVVAADPWLGRLAPDGAPRWPSVAPAQMDPRSQDRTFSVSEDGAVVDFGYVWNGARPARFDVAALTLTTDPPADGRTRPAEQQAMDVIWDETYEPSLGGARLTLDEHEYSRSLAIHPDGKRFVLGTEWYLRAFDDSGAEIWRKEAPSVAWAVNISGDGRLVVAAYGDGTIRWRRMEDGQEILALFPLIDGENWVAWTPEGVYAATPGARGVLRWHTNRGWDQTPTVTEVWRIPETHRPEVIKQVLPQLGLEGAIVVAELAKIRGAVQRATGAAAAPGARLYVLAAGVSDYGPKAAHLTLDYADDDARDLLQTLQTSQTGLYARVDPQFLPNGSATKAGLLRGLDSIGRLMEVGQGRDVAVVHFSGHGAVVDGQFYLLTHEVDMTDAVTIKATALSARDLRAEIQKIAQQGRVILLLDACRSGTTTGDGAALSADAELLRAELRSPNVTVLTSSSGDEDSIEGAQWENGAFTEAVLEGLTTLADQNGDGVIAMGEMAAYVQARTRQITVGRQNPGTDVRFQSYVFAAGL